MRFGVFVRTMSFSPGDDHQSIEDSLREVELAEEIGLDSVWLLEHHFAGIVGYADPVVFAASVAMRTQRIRIGFAVLAMTLHHPVRLAVQTSLLDNLSHGRLIVGVGRGSISNEYEYVGFGTTAEEGRDMLPEAEELLIKAWTSEDVQHEGRFWKVSFPGIRPRPYRKPHPLLVRACHAEESLVEMAKIGRSVLIDYQTLDTLRHRFHLYRDTMSGAGFEETEVENALNESWAVKWMYVAESDAEAMETAALALERSHNHDLEARRKYNPRGVPPPKPGQAPSPGQAIEHAFLAGSPARVAEQIAELRDAGVPNLILNVNAGQMEDSMRLFGEKVMPKFQPQ